MTDLAEVLRSEVIRENNALRKINEALKSELWTAKAALKAAEGRAQSAATMANHWRLELAKARREDVSALGGNAFGIFEDDD